MGGERDEPNNSSRYCFTLERDREREREEQKLKEIEIN